MYWYEQITKVLWTFVKTILSFFQNVDDACKTEKHTDWWAYNGIKRQGFKTDIKWLDCDI